VRNLFLITLTAGLFCSLVAAQVPTSGNVYFGYSYYHTNLSSIDTAGTNGWVGSLEGKVFPFVGIVADISAHYGSQNFPTAIPPCPVPAPNCSGTINVDVSEHNYLFGPRVSFSAGRFRPFAEAMFGVGHVNANDAGSDTSFATALPHLPPHRMALRRRLRADPLLRRASEQHSALHRHSLQVLTPTLRGRAGLQAA
jgi:hypothetical protein